MIPRRLPGAGWLALLGGGEFSFGETAAADLAWLDKAPPGTIGFLPAASGSADYGTHFAGYLEEAFERRAVTIPIYRRRDARRNKNLGRIDEAAAIYVGGGVADELLEVLAGSPAAEALGRKLAAGGAVAAIGAAAQVLGQTVRPLGGGEPLAGLGWLPGGVVECNFDPGHDRRLRETLAAGGSWGLGLPAGAAVLLGPEERVEVVGTAFVLEEAEGDYRILSESTSSTGGAAPGPPPKR